MKNPAAVREQRLRKTKAQLIEEIDTLKQHTAALEIGREQAFPESEEMFRSAFETAVHGMNLVAPDGHFLAINNALCEMLGYSVEELLATNIQSTTHPEDIDGDLAKLRALQAGEIRSYQLEKRYIHKRGHLIEVLLSVSLIRNSNGEPLYSVGHVQDITERKQAEAELARKEAQLRVALDNMPGGMFMIDNEFRFQVFNDRVKEIFDIPDEVLRTGGSLRNAIRVRAERGDYGEGDVDELVERRLWGYTDKETLRVEERLPSGRVIELFRRPTDDGGTVVVVTDITERKRAEEALQESETLFRAFVDNAPAEVTLKDADGRFLFVNPEFRQRYDVTDEEVLGKTIDYILPKDVADNSFAEHRKVIETGKVVVSEHQFTYGGAPHTNLVVRFPVPDASGAITKVGAFVPDITERVQAEERLLEAKQRSEEASMLVAEKNRMLESLSSQLSKYLSPQVYASIFAGEQSVEIASKRKKLTVFFSDIADFAETTDSLESEDLTDLLNHYLTAMSKIALDHGATIDKYVGDAIIAFFGDPETRGVKEDAKTCVNMAIAMQRRMRELQSEWLDMGLERPFKLRIGINTGFCTVGNFGSEDRMDYTIIGNEVNLAARLESNAEVGSILIAHETYSLVKDTVMAEERDTLTVKGFAKPIRTYSVVGFYDDLAEQGKIIRKEEKGIRILVDLENRDRADAIQAIKDVLSQLED